MRFTAKASSAPIHHHCTVLTHDSINKDDYYTAHFQPGWIHRERKPGRVNRCIQTKHEENEDGAVCVDLGVLDQLKDRSGRFVLLLLSPAYCHCSSCCDWMTAGCHALSAWLKLNLMFSLGDHRVSAHGFILKVQAWCVRKTELNDEGLWSFIHISDFWSFYKSILL